MGPVAVGSCCPLGWLGGGSGGSSGSGSSGSSSSTGVGAPSDISAIAAKVDPGLVDINTNLSYESEAAAGTGQVLTSNGEILTNNHVIDGATSISVTDIGNGKTCLLYTSPGRRHRLGTAADAGIGPVRVGHRRPGHLRSG